MEVQQKDDGKQGLFYIEHNGMIAAEMTYVWAGTDRIIIDHTEVDDVLRGKSAGKQLVAKSVEFARDKKISIIPLCPFAKSVFDKTPEYSDVL
ncbi:MAG: N-acetyltransferase [Bacteroidetes bacterium]|nr:MAG: N-acetyltransferase [Bacteroidota bacterium]